MLFRSIHYILISERHIISSSQKCTLYPLLKNLRYILSSEMYIISSSQINTINPSQINTICPLQRYTQYIIFPDRHTISSFQYTNCILFTEIHISSFQINTLQKSTLYTLLRNAHCIHFSDKHIIFC